MCAASLWSGRRDSWQGMLSADYLNLQGMSEGRHSKPSIPVQVHEGREEMNMSLHA